MVTPLQNERNLDAPPTGSRRWYISPEQNTKSYVAFGLKSKRLQTSNFTVFSRASSEHDCTNLACWICSLSESIAVTLAPARANARECHPDEQATSSTFKP